MSDLKYTWVNLHATGVRPSRDELASAIVGVLREQRGDEIESRNAVNGRMLDGATRDALVRALRNTGVALEHAAGGEGGMELPQFAWLDPLPVSGGRPSSGYRTLALALGEDSYMSRGLFGAAAQRGLAATCYEMATALSSFEGVLGE